MTIVFAASIRARLKKKYLHKFTTLAVISRLKKEVLHCMQIRAILMGDNQSLVSTSATTNDTPRMATLEEVGEWNTLVLMLMASSRTKLYCGDE